MIWLLAGEDGTPADLAKFVGFLLGGIKNLGVT
jgi:hypothetical protein